MKSTKRQRKMCVLGVTYGDNSRESHRVINAKERSYWEGIGRLMAPGSVFMNRNGAIALVMVHYMVMGFTQAQ